MASKVDLRESQVLSQVLQYLAYHPKVAKAWRVNTGASKYNYTTKQGIKKNYFVKYGEKGQADIQGYLKDGRALFVEVKRSEGGKVSPHQKNFIQNAKEVGCFACVVCSVDELEREFKSI